MKMQLQERFPLQYRRGVKGQTNVGLTMTSPPSEPQPDTQIKPRSPYSGSRRS